MIQFYFNTVYNRIIQTHTVLELRLLNTLFSVGARTAATRFPSLVLTQPVKAGLKKSYVHGDSQ